MTKQMALITTAGRAAWSLPLHPRKAVPVGFALGHELDRSSEAAAFSALTLSTEPTDSVWSQYFMDPWGYGEISMIAPQLAVALGALVLAPVCAQFAPVERSAVVASGVALEPCSVLPSVTRVMLAPLGSSLPSLEAIVATRDTMASSSSSHFTMVWKGLTRCVLSCAPAMRCTSSMPSRARPCPTM